MKLIFFVIAFCLVTIRVYFSWKGEDSRKGNKGDIVIKSDGLDERIGWLGQVQLNDSETSIVQISPGGYVHYTRNDTQVIAESNVKGVIAYQFPKPAGLTDSGKMLILQQAVRELVAYGYEAPKRMERIYQRGGNPALMRELGRVKLDNLQTMYLKRILQSDSLSTGDLMALIGTTGALGNDQMKSDLLKKFSLTQLDTPKVRAAYFGTVDHLFSDVAKQDVLASLIQQGTLSAPLIDQVLLSAGGLTADIEKQDIYKKIIDTAALGEEQWKKLLVNTGSFTADTQKSDMLIYIAKKMTRSEALKAQYVKTAKTIVSDYEYGRVMRSIDW